MPKTRRIAIALDIDNNFAHHQHALAGVLRYAKEREDWICQIDEHPGYHSRRKTNKGQYLCDGVIARASLATYRRLKRLKIPLVNTHYQMHKPGMAGVYADPAEIGREAANHLINRGFKHLMVLRKSEHRMSVAVGDAFKAIADDSGVKCEIIDPAEGIYTVMEDWARIQNDIERFFDGIKPPVALFVETIAHARLLIQHAINRGLSVPHDVAVISQHCLVNTVATVSPQLTTVDLNYDRVGYEAAHLLDRLMQGEPIPERPILIPPKGIIARETTDFISVDDPLVSDALRYITQHIREPLRVDDLAYELAVSKRLLLQRFSTALGKGPSEEIRRLRLELAKRLLAEPDRPISSIPKLSGLSSPSVMNRAFQREMGMTPSEYRESILGEH